MSASNVWPEQRLTERRALQTIIAVLSEPELPLNPDQAVRGAGTAARAAAQPGKAGGRLRCRAGTPTTSAAPRNARTKPRSHAPRPRWKASSATANLLPRRRQPPARLSLPHSMIDHALARLTHADLIECRRHAVANGPAVETWFPKP
jgi:hypothetical protein